MSHDLNRLLLESLASGRFVSGEQLAERCGISRTAVWKRLQKFSAEWGLELHSVRGKGHRLAAPLELLDADSIGQQAGCAPYLPEVFLSLPSTSNYLQQQLDTASLQPGASCFAEHQTSGRGRRGRSWISPFATNLYFSVYWRFDCSMSELGGLSMVIGAVLCRIVRQYGAEGAGLKWPNDVIVDARKLAGVLVDIHGSADGPVDAIIGIGLNVAMPATHADAIDQPWVDLDSLLTGDVSRNRLAADLLIEVREALETYERDGFEAFVDEWRSYDTFLGETVSLLMGQQHIHGTHAGIAPDGALLLERDGIVQRYHSGEVSLRKRR